MDGALGAKRSSERGGAPGGSRSDIRWEIREDERRHRRVRFLLPHDDTLSRSLIRVDTTHDGDEIERPGSTSIFIHL